MDAVIYYPSPLYLDLVALLRKHGMPESTTSFVVRCDVNDVVRIECTFTPTPEPLDR